MNDYRILGLLVLLCSCGGKTAGTIDALDGVAPEARSDLVVPGPDGSGSEARVAKDVLGSVDRTCNPRELADGEVRAKPVVCAEELLGGPNAIGAVGDFLLENSRVRFIVRSGAAHVFVGMDGGNVVDADRVRATGEPGQDRLQEILPLFSFNSLSVEAIEITNPGMQGEAVVAVRGKPVPMPYLASVLSLLPTLEATVTHEYVLKADASYLILRTRVEVEEGGADVSVMPIDGFFASGELLGFEPGPGLSGDADLEIPVLIGQGSGVSYGFLGSKGYELTSLGAVSLATGDSIPVKAGKAMAVERFLFVGDGSVSSITDRITDHLGVATGAVAGCVQIAGQPAGSGYEVLAADIGGQPLTCFLTDQDGCFGGQLPVGKAVLTAGCPGCGEGVPVDVDVITGADGPQGLTLVATTESFVQATVSDGEGKAIPARLTVEPLEPAVAPVSYLLAWPAARLFPLPPGHYRITASRGFEYEREILEDVEVGLGETVQVTLELERSVQTLGAVAAEFHIHSENSVDSFVPLPDRIRACVTEGVEFVVATDHDFVADYAPVIESLELGPFVKSTPGVEISSVQAGHFNAWPLTPAPELSGNGALAWFGLSPGEIVEAIREDHPGRIVEVNHPRFQDAATFDLIEFDPSDGKAHADPEDLGFAPGTDLNVFDFDAMEVFNGVGDEELEEQLIDWYALLNLGYRISATAGGDSHDFKAFPGNPRNLVQLGEDDPSAVTVEAVNDAVRGMRVLVTSGPYIEAGLIDPISEEISRSGDVVTDSGTPRLSIRVQAPKWMEITELSIVMNGQTLFTQPVEDAGDPELRDIVRFDDVVEIPAVADSWFVVRTSGQMKEPHQANHRPIALTNPFYLDADGNGQFDPPGLF